MRRALRVKWKLGPLGRGPLCPEGAGVPSLVAEALWGGFGDFFRHAEPIVHCPTVSQMTTMSRRNKNPIGKPGTQTARRARTSTLPRQIAQVLAAEVDHL